VLELFKDVSTEENGVVVMTLADKLREQGELHGMQIGI